MVEVGSLSMKLSLDNGAFKQGLDEVDRGMDRMQDKTKSAGSDFSRIEGITNKLSMTFKGLAIAGTAALVGLATKSPAVAPALAEMKVIATQLGIQMGQALAPAFEMAADKFKNLADFLIEHKDTIGAIGEAAVKYAPAIITLGGAFALKKAATTGISLMNGLIASMATATVSAELMAALGLAAIGGAAIYTLATAGSTLTGDTTNVPIPAAAQAQIAGSYGTPEGYQLINLYAARNTGGTGFGAPSTPEVGANGELIVMPGRINEYIASSSGDIIDQIERNLGRRFLAYPTSDVGG